MDVAPDSSAALQMPFAGRILYVITKANWGGAQRYVYEVALAAQKLAKEKGGTVTVAVGDRGELTRRLSEANIPSVLVPGLARDVSFFGDVKALLNLVRLMRTERPQVVHANSSKAGFLAAVAARLQGFALNLRGLPASRVIFTAHGWAFNESRPWWQKVIFALFHLITVWLADVVICVSEAVRRDASWMPFARGKFQVVRHGIDPIELVPRGAARAKLAPHASTEFLSRTWIGTLAELHPTKGLDTAIRAFAQIAPDFPDAALVLIGEGQDRNRLVALAQELRVIDHVLFCGHVRNAATLLTAFDIFLFPSRSEALGYAALEAGNASLPVVASSVGGIPEIIEDGTTGLLAPVGDVDAFVSALTSLLADADLRKRLGDALHAHVLNEFPRKRMLEQTLALYS